MGHLYKRNGTFWAYYYDRANVRQRCSTRTSDPQVARARLRDFELQTTDRGTHPTEDLSDALDYFTDVTCAGRSPGTVRCYKQKAAHLNRLLGGTPADKLNRESVERYIAARLAEGAHRHSVHKELVVLRGALKSCRARDRFHGSLEVVPEFDSGYVPRTAYLTIDQFLRLVPHLAPPTGATAKPRTIERREALVRRRALYCLLIAYASPRRGELEALQWEHVDLGRGVILVPKGKTVGRPVRIHEVLRPWLEGFGAIAEWTGPIVDPWANVGRDLPAACKRAGVPRCTPNDLRRSFASWLIQAGVSNRIVAKLLGHNTTRMVDLVYGQLDEETLTAAIGKLPGGCVTGVSGETTSPGTPGAGGTTHAPMSIVNSVETAQTSTEFLVPRDGIEPPTRGFSGLMEMAPKAPEPARKLRAV